MLQCGADEGPLQAGSVNARMAQLFVLDVLFQEFCMRAPEETEPVSYTHLDVYKRQG